MNHLGGVRNVADLFYDNPVAGPVRQKSSGAVAVVPVVVGVRSRIHSGSVRHAARIRGAVKHHRAFGLAGVVGVRCIHVTLEDQLTPGTSVRFAVPGQNKVVVVGTVHLGVGADLFQICGAVGSAGRFPRPV